MEKGFQVYKAPTAEIYSFTTEEGFATSFGTDLTDYNASNADSLDD